MMNDQNGKNNLGLTAVNCDAKLVDQAGKTQSAFYDKHWFQKIIAFR